MKIQIIPGVTATLLRGNVPLAIGSAGSVGRLQAKDRLDLQLEGINGDTIIAFLINGNRDILRMIPKNGTVARTINVLSHSGKIFTSPDQNYIMVVQLTKSGAVLVHVVCVIGQNGEFFLIHQQTHSAQAYRGQEKAVVPDLIRRFAGWKQLNDLASTHYATNHSLPPVTDWVAKKFDTSTLKDNQVVVTSWSARRGTGGGVNKQGQGVGIYWSQIDADHLAQPRFASIGEIVECRSLQRPQRETQFQWDARGVRRLQEIADMIPDIAEDNVPSNFAGTKPVMAS